MKYHKGDILRYPGNGITWEVIGVWNSNLDVKLLSKGSSNHPNNIGHLDCYPLHEWRQFVHVNFTSYLRKL